MINFIDLFAGAGGLSEGFTQAGYNPVAHVEMNTAACFTLKTRACYYYLKEQNKLGIYHDYLKGNITREELYSSVPSIVLESVINETMSKNSMQSIFSTIDSLMQKRKIEQIDLIVGGPPCQAYSLVGRAVKGESMLKDPRNYLYKLYVQVLKKYRPKMFIFENVPGLLNANGGQYFADIKKTFSKAGYTIGYNILDSSSFNVLQSRRRVILIGWLHNIKMKYPSFEESTPQYQVRDIFFDLPPVQPGESNNEYATSEYSKYLVDTGIRGTDDILTWHVARPNIKRDRNIYRRAIRAWNNNGRRLKYTDLPDELCTHKNRSAFLDRFKVVAQDLPTCHTIMAHLSKDGHYFIHPDLRQARSITVREAARIQSFPDNFYFEGSRTAVFTQIGNAVPPLMARGIAGKIKNNLECTK